MSTLLALLIILFACSSDPASPDGSVVFNLDGAGWEADTLQIALYDDVLGNLSINGIRASDQTNLILDLSDVQPNPGTFELADDDYSAIFYDFTSLEIYRTTSIRTGTLNVTTWTDSRVKGTFSFDAQVDDDSTQVIEVRNGSFDVPVR